MKRFDADKAERNDWAGDDETLWYLTDGNSNGRWLYVDSPDTSGSTEVGIARVYRKHLSPAALRSFAAALLEVAEKGEAIMAAVKAARDAQAEREHQCTEDGGHKWGPPPLTVTHATAAYTSSGSSHLVQCVRCDNMTWLNGDEFARALPLAQRHQPDTTP